MGPSDTNILETVFANAGVGLCLLDGGGHVVMVNAAWREASAMPDAEVVGKHIWALFPGAPDALRRQHDAARRGTTQEVHPVAFERHGRTRWYEGRLTPVAMADGVGLLVTSVDVTEQRRAEAAARASEAALRDAQRLAALGSWAVDLASGARTWSDELYRILGRDPALGPATLDELGRLYPTDDWPRLNAATYGALAGGGPYEVELRLQHPDGTLRHLVNRGEAVRDAGGKVVGLRGTLQDVTDRRRARETVRVARNELRAIVQASPVPIVALDVEGRVVLWSAAAERVFGWTSAEVVGRPLPIVPDDRRDELAALVASVHGGEEVHSVVTERTTRDGQRIPVSVSAAALRGFDGEPIGTVRVLIDLREQTALREALAESEQRFAAAFEASPMAKLLIRVADRLVVEVNRAYLQLSGLAREDVIGKTPQNLSVVPAGDLRQVFWRRIAAREPVSEVAFEYHTAGGPSRDAVASAERITVRGEEYVLVVVQDVTERRRAERALQDSDARFRQLADTIQEVFWLTDLAKGQVVYVSPGYDAIWGRPSAALYANARDWVDAIHPDDRARVLDAALTKQAAGTYDEEYRIVRPDGVVRWIRDRAFPVRDASGRVVRVAGTAQDITERRELEAQLRQTQKMESIGQLAGGIAHDFNNLLTVIAGNCHILADVLPAAPESADLLGEIQLAGERAATLTRQLLAFSRREVIEVRVVDLAAVIVDTEKMLRRILGEDVLLTTALGPESSRVKVDAGSWVQVLMNLAVNARDAMPRGGRLRIETGRVVLGDDFVRTHPHVAPGAYVTLTVSDSGRGMAPAVLARVFEPFFTTKELGRGTGLGLSVVHGIVAQSGGHIDVASEVDVGTTFRIYLPAVESAASPAAPVSKPVPRGGVETILLVEDEASIRRVAIRCLEKLGYVLLQAGDGEEALRVVGLHAGRIDLLLTDVVMPRMDGRELAEVLRARDPTLRVLYTSGYTDDAVVRHGIQHAEVAFLPKPYDMTTLRQKVREVLDRT